MAYPPKYNDNEMREIATLIRRNAVQLEDDSWQMAVTDDTMRSILGEYCYYVNRKYVTRFRTKMGISAVGVAHKFSDAQLLEMQKYICTSAEKTEHTWKATISDSELCDILNAFDLPVNVKFVERIRRSLSIEPLNEKGGFRPGAGRPLQGNYTQDPEYASLINLHNLCVYQLSDHMESSGALPGQAGMDISDHFGTHTLSFNDAITRKNNALKPSKKKVKNHYHAPEKNIESEYTVQTVFNEEAAEGTFGKVGKQGGVRRVSNDLAYQARFGQ